MSEHDARVSELVAEGRITPEEGERLRRALRSGGGVWTIVRSPVEYLRPAYAAALAVAITAASLAVSRLGIRFDGALDVHRVLGVPPWSIAFLDQAVAIPLTAAVFWLASLVVARQGRLQDFIVAVAVGRLPSLLLAIWAVVVLPVPPPPEELVRQMASGEVPLRVLIGGVSGLAFMAWLFVWLYRGFAVGSGMKGPRTGVAFVLAIVVAEVLSKLVLRALMSLM